MPLLQGQPFKLISPPDVYPIDSEVYTIQHTGEKFLSKSDYEDRLALYSQTIWTCQCTGHTGLTHKEAWMSEAKVRVAAKNAVPVALQKPLLSLVHHSLSPLEQLIDAASILCHSQFHVGEEVLLLCPKQIKVRIINAKENTKFGSGNSKTSSHTVLLNGIPSEKETVSILNGNANGISKNESPETSPGKENQAKEMLSSKDDSSNKREMIPKLYDVMTLEDHDIIENVSTKSLLRPYKIPSKDHLRLFIRSCALRHRGSTCTPWVVSEDLVKTFNISNKLPTLFLSSPKPNQSSSKRKAQSPAVEVVKRAKSEFSDKVKVVSKVPPLVIKSETSVSENKKCSPEDIKKNSVKYSVKNNSQHSLISNKMGSKPSWASITKHPLSIGKPKILPRPSSNMSNIAKSILAVSKGLIPRKRGRPPLSKEEKERNKKLRQATLLDLSKKISNPDAKLNIIKVKPHSEVPPITSTYLQPSNSILSACYKSPVKRANTPDAIMKLPIMRRFIHEHKTIKGVLGQFRRYAYTMDLVLSKLALAQIELIPDEALKLDLLTRHKKVQDKKFFEKLTPEEKKQFLKDKARTVALERWKERKLKNLKVEDKLVSGLVSLPTPILIETPQGIPNSLFGDIAMITDFIKCFQELLLGEEKFQILSSHLMEAIVAGAEGYKVIADIICCFLPIIIHDDISKNNKEIGVPISGIPITYQTAHELARLCLRKQDEDDIVYASEDNYQLGKEKNELSDDLLIKLETTELWNLSCHEIVSVLKALVHKSLSTAAISVYVEEIEEKVLRTLRERRKFLKQMQKDQKAEMEKKKEEKKQNKMAKDVVPKKQRGRPKGYSPKFGTRKLQDFFASKDKVESLSSVVQKRRLSAEISKKEKAEMQKLEKERQKQLEEIQKRHSVDKKYEEVVFKRDNLLRRTPIGFDRDHNRYWIFHTTTPGLYVEKGWVDHNTNYTYSLHQHSMLSPSKMESNISPVKNERMEMDDEEQPLSIIIGKEEEEDSKPLSVVQTMIKNDCEEDNQPLSIVQSQMKMEIDEDNRPLATVKSKLTLSPMKMTFRGRPPKETYVLVDEDTQTFPIIAENKWYYYPNMEEVKKLLSCLSDQGQRESQLIAAISINRDKLQYHFNKRPEPLKLSLESANRLQASVKEDIIQIARELIEGWLGGIPEFEEWESNAQMAEDVATMGRLLIDVQKHMQIKYLKSIMTPIKREVISNSSSAEGTTEYEDVEGPGVERWRAEVRSCRTYSRLHVLVGLFDSCIKWEKSMATRKCKVCRNKAKQDPLVMCDKCANSYHWYCLRPSLKEDPGESWKCPACMPKKTRREEIQPIENDYNVDDQDEKDDPTFCVDKRGRECKKKKFLKSAILAKQEKECVVCLGRIGLICCSKCTTPYHSECHNPPLMSRARKDWVCGSCLNPKQGKFKVKKEEVEEDQFTRRNYFGNIETISFKKRSGNSGPRDQFGRFLKGKFKSQHADSSFSEGYDDEKMDDDLEEEDSQIDKFGRSIRGAKAKALESIADPKHKKYDSRRSSRNPARKNYKDESENDDDDSEENDNSEEEDAERADDSEETRNEEESEEENEKGENGTVEESDEDNEQRNGREQSENGAAEESDEGSESSEESENEREHVAEEDESEDETDSEEDHNEPHDNVENDNHGNIIRNEGSDSNEESESGSDDSADDDDSDDDSSSYESEEDLQKKVAHLLVRREHGNSNESDSDDSEESDED